MAAIGHHTRSKKHLTYEICQRKFGHVKGALIENTHVTGIILLALKSAQYKNSRSSGCFNFSTARSIIKRHEKLCSVILHIYYLYTLPCVLSCASNIKSKKC